MGTSEANLAPYGCPIISPSDWCKGFGHDYVKVTFWRKGVRCRVCGDPQQSMEAANLAAKLNGYSVQLSTPEPNAIFNRVL